MEITKASEPPVARAELPPEQPPAVAMPPSLSDIPIAPFDLNLEESPKVRTKLRLYLILSALYVTCPALSVYATIT